jgi:hypothetical protein
MIIAYEAINEEPRVFCAYGKTPAKALTNMAKLLKKSEIFWMSASHVSYIEEEDLFYITIYV